MLIRSFIVMVFGLIYYQVINLIIDRLLFLYLAIVLALVWLVILIRRIINLKGRFLKEVVREQMLRFRYASLVLKTGSAFIPGLIYNRKTTVLAIKKEPWVFSRSFPVFKKRDGVGLLTETCVKAVLRNRRHLLSYAQLILGAIAAVLSFPLKWKLIAWGVLAIVFTKFGEIFWHEMKQSPFMKILPWQKEVMYKAAPKTLFILMMLGYFPVSLALGVQLCSWGGAVLFPVLAGVIGLLTANVVGYISGS